MGAAGGRDGAHVLGDCEGTGSTASTRRQRRKSVGDGDHRERSQGAETARPSSPVQQAVGLPKKCLEKPSAVSKLGYGRKSHNSHTQVQKKRSKRWRQSHKRRQELGCQPAWRRSESIPMPRRWGSKKRQARSRQGRRTRSRSRTPIQNGAIREPSVDSGECGMSAAAWRRHICLLDPRKQAAAWHLAR